MPATMRDILGSARMAGRKIMELVDKGIKVSDIVTREALENAVIIHSAIGGSTNATIHLPAIARELGPENWELFWSRNFLTGSIIRCLIWEILHPAENTLPRHSGLQEEFPW